MRGITLLVASILGLLAVDFRTVAISRAGTAHDANASRSAGLVSQSRRIVRPVFDRHVRRLAKRAAGLHAAVGHGVWFGRAWWLRTQSCRKLRRAARHSGLQRHGLELPGTGCSGRPRPDGSRPLVLRPITSRRFTPGIRSATSGTSATTILPSKWMSTPGRSFVVCICRRASG